MNLIDKIKEALKLGARTKSAKFLEEEPGYPIFYLVGSMTDCTYKMAVAYARGLAEHYTSASDETWIRVYDDKENSRYIYEIQEGGKGVSYINTFLELLAAPEAQEVEGQEPAPRVKKIHLPLVNDAYATIADERGMMFSLITQNAEIPSTSDEEIELDLTSLDEKTAPAMRPLYPSNKRMAMAGGALLTLSLTGLTIVGGAYVAISSGLVSDDAFSMPLQREAVATYRDNPMVKFNQAKAQASRNDQYIHVLKKEKGRWTWNLKDNDSDE